MLLSVFHDENWEKCHWFQSQQNFHLILIDKCYFNSAFSVAHFAIFLYSTLNIFFINVPSFHIIYILINCFAPYLFVRLIYLGIFILFYRMPFHPIDVQLPFEVKTNSNSLIHIIRKWKWIKKQLFFLILVFSPLWMKINLLLNERHRLRSTK